MPLSLPFLQTNVPTSRLLPPTYCCPRQICASVRYPREIEGGLSAKMSVTSWMSLMSATTNG